MASSTKSSAARTQKASPRKKATRVSKAAPKKRVAKAAAVPHKVDYYPNRMTLAVAVLAGTLLVLISIITVLGVQ
jgi:hypothetical protein